MARLTIDPVTRTGGHLRVEVEVDGGVVTDAWVAGTMYRGVERIVEGRDPREAWLVADRVCGACTPVHALASVRAVEDALGITVPANARLLRNVMAGTQLVRDHVVGFYRRLALDWVDPESALRADPETTARLAASMSDWPQASAVYFRSVKARLATLLGAGRGSFLAGGPWGHRAYRLKPEQNLLLVGHLVEALDWNRRVARINTMLGGKTPHPQTFLVGGLVVAPAWGGPARPGEHPRQVDRRSPVALSSEGLADLAAGAAEVRTFVDAVFAPDVLMLAEAYGDWAALGRGHGRYLALGEFPEVGAGLPSRLLADGWIAPFESVTARAVDPDAISESFARSHYVAADGDDGDARHPVSGALDATYQGPSIPYSTIADAPRYSWFKAPRYGGQPMEVGPLARTLVAVAEGRDAARASLSSVVARLGLEPSALSSTLGRIVARGVEAGVVADRLRPWLDDVRANLAAGDLAVANLAGWDLGGWPREAEGSSLGEGARGAIGHWVTIRDGVVARYEIVDASTWNASPRDASGRRGPIEEALIGTPVTDPDRPLEILRTVHSFDPCPPCAAH